MKNKYYYLSLLVSTASLTIASAAYAINVNQDVTVQISGFNVTMKSGSAFDSMVRDTNGNLSITVGTGQSVSLEVGSPRQFINDQGVSTSCQGSSSSIGLTGGKTYAVSIGSTCSR